MGAYYYDYKNFLVSASNEIPQDSTCACFVNAPQARADGLELETAFAVTAVDQLSISGRGTLRGRPL
jgi:outer membrane receptor protein involved in Fe transport